MTAQQHSRGQSKVVGVILLTAVIIILVGLLSLFVLSGLDTTEEPVADVEIGVDDSAVRLTHAGGDSLSAGDVRVVFGRGGSGSASLSDFAELAGDGDRWFEGSERRERAHGAGDVISVTVVHEPTNTVLVRSILDVPGTVAETLSWRLAADWDAATARTNVVHDDYGDRSPDRVELGYRAGGAVAFWPLDEDDGTTAVDVAGGNDGIIDGATVGRPGVLGTTGYGFDGTDDYVADATDRSALRTTGSISAWIKTSETGDDTMWQAPGLTGVESNGDGNDIFWGWIDADGHIGMQAGNVPGARSAAPVADGSWHHVVLTRNAATGRVEVYVDGSLDEAASSRSGEITTTFESIGRIEDTAGSPHYFDGRIDEFRVYDRVLSQSEVRTLSETARTGSITTALKSFDAPRNPSGLELADVDVARPSEVTVTVESDPDGDGAIEESADPIVLDGSGSYDLTGLTSESSAFRLRVEFASPDVTASPSFGGAVVRPSD